MGSGFNASDGERFLIRLPIPPGQFLEIRLVVPDRDGAVQRFCTTLDEALRNAGESSGRANVYVGGSPRCRRSGTKAAVTVVTSSWADIDFHQIDANHRAQAERIADERLDRFPHRPTIVVHTGNGLQAWWLYSSPVEISDEWPVDRLEAISRGIAKALGGDAVHDVARVLRVPGTMNLPDAKKRTRGCVPVMARLLYADGPTYVPSQFQSLEFPDPRGGRLRAPHRVDHAAPVEPESEIIDAFEQLIASLGPDHLLSLTWTGKRVFSDRSRSARDMALVNQLYRVDVRAEFIPTIVRAFRFGRGVLARDDYISRTMAKARTRRRGPHETQRSA